MSVSQSSALHCRRLGQGPDLVLLHGWGLHSGIWEPLIEPLSGRFSLHLYDLPGHGHSADAAEFSLEHVCATLAQIAPQEAYWLGWSLGGTLALEFAARYPARVRRLVLTASNPRFVADADWPDAMPPDVLAEFARALDEDYGETLKRFLGLIARGAPDSQVLRELRQAMRAAPGPTIAALHGGLSILRTADLRSRLNELPMPTLLLAGARDTLVPISASRALVAQNPRLRLHEFQQAGHAPFISHTTEFVAALTEFLE